MTIGGFFYSHHRPGISAAIDPIVFPGMVGEDEHGHGPHLHHFGGRIGITADTKAADLIGAPSTGVDRRGGTYWVPALYWNGLEVLPSDFSARYGLGPTSSPETIVAFPPGCGIVAGRKPVNVQWNTDPIQRPTVASFDTPPDPGTRELTCKITFPDLWDGVTPDEPNWSEHFRYSVAKRIPAGWVPVPSLQLKIHWAHLPPLETVELSSGPPSSMHADFLNTWDQDHLEAAVEHCLRGRNNCGEIGRNRNVA